MVALGVAWILDGLEITVASAVADTLTQPETLGLPPAAVGLIASVYLGTVGLWTHCRGIAVGRPWCSIDPMFGLGGGRGRVLISAGNHRRQACDRSLRLSHCRARAYGRAAVVRDLVPRTMLLAVAARHQVLSRCLGRVVDGVRLVVGRHMRLIRRCHNVFHLVMPGGFAMVSRCVLMMVGGIFKEFVQR